MLDIQLKTEGLSEATKAVMELPGLFRRARASALKRMGYQIRFDLQRESRIMEPKLNPHTGVLSVTHETEKRRPREVRFRKKRIKGTNRWIEGTSRNSGRNGLVARKTSTRREPFSRFAQMVQYKVNPEAASVEIGILKPKPNYFFWMDRNAAGFTTHVSPKMRKFLFACGFPIGKGTTELVTPTRPWMAKVARTWDAKAGSFFEEKFWSAFNRYKMGAAKE